MKTALVFNPPTGRYIRDDRCQVPADSISSALRAPLDLLYYATIFKNRGWRVELRDYPALGLGFDDYLSDLSRLSPDVLLTSVTTPTLAPDMACLAAAKEKRPGVTTVAKGAHLAVLGRETLEQYPALDAAIRHEAELAADDLAAGKPLAEIAGMDVRSGNRIVRNPDRPRLLDLDLLPVPDRSLIDNRLYARPDTDEPMASLLAARGCPNACFFCLVPVVSGAAIAKRSPRALVAEMRECVERFGIRNFYLRADTFTRDRAWVEEICDRLVQAGLGLEWVSNSRVDTLDDALAAKMRRAGCWMLGLGVESGDPSVLEKIEKHATPEQAVAAARTCRRNGIKSYAFFMIGFPWEDETSVHRTFALAEKMDCDFVEFHTAYPFPGTPFHEMAAGMGLFEATALSGADVMSSPVRTLHMDDEAVRRLRRRLTRRYYLRPSYVLRTLAGIRSPRVFWNYCRKGASLLRNL